MQVFEKGRRGGVGGKIESICKENNFWAQAFKIIQHTQNMSSRSKGQGILRNCNMALINVFSGDHGGRG